jgi:fluoroquinolone transport system ATP-binding protein
MIAVKNLIYFYPKQPKAAVNDISFEVEKGEIFGFLGPSGAGKSTVQKILIRLLPDFQGELHVLGKPLPQWDASYYNHIGVGFELPNHYLKMTGLENLQLFASMYDKATSNPAELLAMVGLAEDAHKKVESYSKGMKMRLNFVRALLHDPEILFLDEPTSGLDPVNARQMKNIILDMKKQGKTIFITTHNMHDADELCDRVAFIVDGKIKAMDAPKQLKRQGGPRKIRVEYQNGGLQTSEFALEGLGENETFLSMLKAGQLESIHSEEASLEDIFIKVTGRTLA